LGSVKKLAGQTMWYGLSSIAARFVNYLLTPYLTNQDAINIADYGKLGIIYAAIPIFNILFTYGFETAFFRFSARPEYKNSIYNTTAISLIGSTLFFSVAVWFMHTYLGQAIGLADIPYIIQISVLIVAIDAICVIPFAKLRQDGKPRKFAALKVGGILVNVFFTWFFISYCRQALAANPNSWVASFYNPSINPVIYLLLANLLQNIITFLLLFTEFKAIKFEFNTKLWKEMLLYSFPLILAGLGGMINETFDRLMLGWWLPGELPYRQGQVGIYNACYKLSILITLFIQAFKMGAEPFFFKQAEGQNPQRTYARVLKFFVIVISVMFLVVVLFLPLWQLIIGEKYRAGIKVVPILLLANMFLGIYYNLSIWYKLGNKTHAGALITLAGVVITLSINYVFIKYYGYMACAWATFFCYGTMMVISYVWGQKHYRIPYAWKKMVAFVVIAVLVFLLHKWVNNLAGNNLVINITSGLVLLSIYCYFITRVERKEFKKLPFIGKYIK
jgi:O-antigen/teichoic acid export membrane protein